MQHYVIKFVRDLQQVSDVLRILRFSQPLKLTVDIIKLGGAIQVHVDPYFATHLI
jgi:hypothetical protein